MAAFHPRDFRCSLLNNDPFRHAYPGSWLGIEVTRTTDPVTINFGF